MQSCTLMTVRVSSLSLWICTKGRVWVNVAGEEISGKRSRDRKHTPIGDHVEHAAEFTCLSQCSSGLSIEGIEETRDGVEDGTVFRMVGHET